jgi:hypothetical protein
MQGAINLIFVFNNYLVDQRQMQILGTSEYIQQCFSVVYQRRMQILVTSQNIQQFLGMSETNVNIRYIRIYTSNIWCIRE